MQIDEYIDMGIERPNIFIEEHSKNMWQLTEWGDLIETTTGTLYPLTVGQRIRMGCLTTEMKTIIQNLKEGKTMQKGNVYYEIIHGEYGSGFCSYCLDSEGRISRGNSEFDMSRILALKKKESNMWTDGSIIGCTEVVGVSSKYYHIIASVLKKVYNKYSIDESSITYEPKNLANALIYKGIDDRLVEASLAYGDGIGMLFLQMSMKKNKCISPASEFGRRFMEGSIPHTIYNGVLLATKEHEPDSMLSSQVAYEGSFIKVCLYTSAYMPIMRKAVIIILEGKECVTGNKHLEEQMNRLGEVYAEEWQLYMQTI